MKFTKYLNEIAKITFRDENTGYHSGQSNNRLLAIIDNETVGYLDYVVYNDEVSISYISGSKRHKGVGRELVLELQRMFPKTEIEWGMTTTQGTALYKSIKSKLYIDKARINKIKSLKREYKRLKKIEDDTIKSGDWSNWDNDIYDKQYDIEQELANMGVYDI